jgi:Anti-sigma factor NepR
MEVASTDGAGARSIMNRGRVQRIPYADAEAAPKKLGSEIKAKIGQQLRAMYADVVNQGVPERFAEILGKLDEKSSVETVKAEESTSIGEVSPTGERSDGPPR